MEVKQPMNRIRTSERDEQKVAFRKIPYNHLLRSVYFITDEFILIKLHAAYIRAKTSL